jgi:hypothetical protein
MHPNAPRSLAALLLAALLLAALLLTTGLTAQAKDETTPLRVDVSFDPTAVAGSAFEVADTRALKGITRVAVPVFAVEFITADNVSAQTSGFAAAGRATSSLYYKLLGVGEPDFQAITNTLYAQFLADLKASGVEVLGSEVLKASPTYAKLVASGAPGSIVNDASMQMSPTGLGLYGFAKMGGGNSAKSKGVFGALSDLGAGFSAVGAIGDTIALSQELGASLIEVRMRVSFVQLSDNNRGFLGRLSGTASTSGQTAPRIDNVMVGVQSREWRSTLTLKHTLTLDGTAFAEVREKAATAGDVAGAVAVGLLRLAIGSGDSSSSTEMEVVADPARYPAVIGAGLASAGGIVVARLKAER